MKETCTKNAALPVPPEKKSPQLRAILAVSVLFLLAIVCAAPAAADTVEAGSASDLQNAIENAKPGVEQTIIINQSFFTGQTIFVIDNGKNIILKPATKSGIKITRNAVNITAGWGLFTVKNNSKLTLADNGTYQLTLHGIDHSSNCQPVVSIQSESTFAMSGGIITGNHGDDGGGISVSNSTFTMSGGTITGNTAGRGGGIYLWGGGPHIGDIIYTSTMSGGTITGNIANNGGGIYVHIGRFEMSGTATLSDNTATRTAGGVYLSMWGMGFGTLCMEDNAIISHNTAPQGGGVYFSPTNIFEMSGNATVASNNEIYLANDYSSSSNVFITLTGTSFTGSALNIAGETEHIKIGHMPVRTALGSTITAQTILKNFALQNQSFALTPSPDNKALIIVLASAINASSVTITPYTDTIANISFSLAPSPHIGATGACITLINQNNPEDVLFTEYNTKINPGGTVSNVQVSGLTPGGTYNLTITPQNTSTSGKPNTYYHPYPYTPFSFPVITTTSLPAGSLGTLYRTTLTAQGTAPILWSIASNSTFPPGLTLSSTGLISGKPTTLGTTQFTINATNNWGIATKTLTLTINPPPSPIPTRIPSGSDSDSPSLPISSSSTSISTTGQAVFGGITSVSFAKGTTGTVIVNTRPQGITAPANSYTVYDITAPSFDGYAQIEFRVPLAALTHGGYTPNDVVLKHYTGGKWITLSTTYLGEERGVATYVALTKSFSPFAIAYEIGGAPTIEQATPEPTDTQTGAAATAKPVSQAVVETSLASTTTVPTSVAVTGDQTARPTLTQAPVSVFGVLFGLFAAGILRKRVSQNR